MAEFLREHGIIRTETSEGPGFKCDNYCGALAKEWWEVTKVAGVVVKSVGPTMGAIYFDPKDKEKVEQCQHRWRLRHFM